MSSGDVRIDKRGPGLLAWAPWIVIAVGILVMVVLFVVAVVALTGDGSARPSAEPPVRPAIVPAPTEFDEPSAEPTPTASASGSPSATASVLPSATSASPSPSVTSAGPSATTRRPSLTGTYQAYDGTNSFVGELRIRNSSTGSRNWTATLSFPDSAGDLRSYWVDGGSRPAMTQSGNRYVFSGTVAGGASIALSLQFRQSDGTVRPVECSVSGTACVIA